MKTSTRFVNAAILNLFTALALCTLCEWIAILQGQIPGWAWPVFGINFVLAWCIATIIGMFPGLPKWGVDWAMKRSNPSEGAKFGALVNVPINSVYSLVLCFVMTVWNVVCLPAIFTGTPGSLFPGVVLGFLTQIVPVWLLCYVVTFLLVQPVEKLARKICNDPAPEMPQMD